MRIGLNTLFLVPGKMGGSEIYARSLIEAIARLAPNQEFHLFANRENAPSWNCLPANVAVTTCPVSGANKAGRTLFEQYRLGALVQRLGVGLLHSLGGTMPLVPRTIKSVVTILDIIFLLFPREFQPIQRFMAARLMRRAAFRADRILTISEHSKKDIAMRFEISPAKIDVTLLGTRSLLKDEDAVNDFFLRHQLSHPYLFTVSSSYHHKNLARLLKVFSQLRRKRPGLKLVVSGLAMAAHGEFLNLQRQLGLEDAVHFAGWVPEPVLRGLYERAQCFVFPSLYEGFGLPVLEAMSLGVPVACARAASLPEVGGNAVLYFDPADENNMATALDRCLSEEDLRKSLAAKGSARASLFSWDQCARQTLAAYEKAMA